MSDSPYLVGIDLGTSNCAVAFAGPVVGPGITVTDFPIPQWVRLGEFASRSVLPSCVYLPGEHELPQDAIALPWDPAPLDLIGEFAREQGAKVPGRLVISAKSWLCHPGVDRSAPILPWGAIPGVSRISPVDASARLLRHMIQCWDQAHPSAPLAVQEVVLTVPASFDEVARALTVNAARQAGLERFTLLEEPQAAFYDFTARHGPRLHQVLEGIRLVLVVDVGGGTSDFTLVEVQPSPEGPALRRIAVGDHLMLGGDNMDAALARAAEEHLRSATRRLSPTQWTQLVQASRLAKETLLAENGPDLYRLAVAGEGSRLVGGSLSAELTRREAIEIILEGFFPACRPDEPLQRGVRGALQELGLPYAQDPAITRQLAAFLRAHAQASQAASGETQSVPSSNLLMARPDAILLNGGVFNSARLSERLIEVISNWWPEAPPIPMLAHDSLELAVARGAAWHGLARRGLGHRIGGGTAHAFYVGLETATAEAAKVLCLIPRGHEEGQPVDLGGRVFQLTLGRPVQFPLFTATSDRVEIAGQIVPWADDLRPLPPLHAVLKSTGIGSGPVSVHLRALLTEIGTLELWCVSNVTHEQWRLEFELRGSPGTGAEAVIESLPPRFSEVRAWLEQFYGSKAPSGSTPAEPRRPPPRDVRHLWASLEQTLGPRETWRVPLLRELWAVLAAGSSRRRRSADHERVFFQLCGYTLRPGFGYPLDAWRCDQVARLLAEGVQFSHEKPVWIEFWVMGRRIAGGLNEAQHRELWISLKPHLAYRLPVRTPKQIAKPKGVQPEGLDEMVRLTAALEHLPPEEKTLIGGWLAARLLDPTAAGGPWAWALGRIGARVPLYGSVHQVVPTEHAAQWLDLLLDAHARGIEGALFAIVQLARLSGDRSRDLEDDLRRRALEALAGAAAPPSWHRLVTEVIPMEDADEARALGDTLPLGLTA